MVKNDNFVNSQSMLHREVGIYEVLPCPSKKGLYSHSEFFKL